MYNVRPHPDWSLLGVKFKISDEHPRPFHMGVPPGIIGSLFNQRSLRDSTILHGVCVGEMLVLKAICDALTPAYLIEQFGN